ncbi:hypothetical protein [Singulisphaera sp. PoT]|uniref:hypothetical protein n=1 Tax=Singulisphaera sp. PoT TaxID=3411797 RepID=UPI003BF60116
MDYDEPNLYSAPNAPLENPKDRPSLFPSDQPKPRGILQSFWFGGRVGGGLGGLLGMMFILALAFLPEFNRAPPRTSLEFRLMFAAGFFVFWVVVGAIAGGVISFLFKGLSTLSSGRKRPDGSV